MHVKGHNALAWTSTAQTAKFRAAMEAQQREALAKRVTNLRERKGWTEADLWQESGVSIQTISRIENAKTTDPRENTLRSLAKAFGITREELAGPRASPEEVELAYEAQLDRIEGMLRMLILRLPGSAEALEQELLEAVRQARASARGSAPSLRAPSRKRKAR